MTVNVDVSREAALKILYDINEKNAYSNIAINKHLNDSNLRDIDKVFISGLVYGTVKWRLTIDWIISEFSNIPFKKLSPWILNILRLGIYQLLYTDRIPDSAACNESVKLAAKYGHRASKNYVNGVLRNIARKGSGYKCPDTEYPNIKYLNTKNPDKKHPGIKHTNTKHPGIKHTSIKHPDAIYHSMAFPDRTMEPVRYLSIRYSHPEWMVKRWMDLFGEDFTESLLQSNNENPDFTVRVNTIRISKADFAKKMEDRGIEFSNCRYIDNAFIINNPALLADSDLFREGYFQVQDEASMLVSHILDPMPEELVLDVCAAPGGKSSHIAQLMGNKGMVISRDIHKHKIKLINETVSRLCLNIVKAELYDAVILDPYYIEKADRVLVDAPCTGLGIIRRKPDIKWTRDIEDKEKIRSLQSGILKTAAEYVKPGGVLVYSTCTIEPDENIEIVREFLKTNSQFHMMGFDELLPRGLFEETNKETKETKKTKETKEMNEVNKVGEVREVREVREAEEVMETKKGKNAKEGYMQLFPNIDNTDGFFIAKMRKRG